MHNHPLHSALRTLPAPPPAAAPPQVTIEDDVLVLSIDGDFSTNRTISITVTTPNASSLEFVQNSGAGERQGARVRMCGAKGCWGRVRGQALWTDRAKGCRVRGQQAEWIDRAKQGLSGASDAQFRHLLLTPAWKDSRRCCQWPSQILGLLDCTCLACMTCCR